MSQETETTPKKVSYLSKEWCTMFFQCLRGKGYGDDPRLGAADIASSARTLTWSVGGPLLSAKAPWLWPAVKAAGAKVGAFFVAAYAVAKDLILHS